MSENGPEPVRAMAQVMVLMREPSGKWTEAHTLDEARAAVNEVFDSGRKIEEISTEDSGQGRFLVELAGSELAELQAEGYVDYASKDGGYEIVAEMP
jgi:hypothetical protein